MKIALVGNQNSGKTTLFNALTGENQKIGNWPGVTIEKKEGRLEKQDILIVDLPGIYSLSPYSSEEIISRDFLLNDKPDLIINIIDSTALERSLYLSTQLMELDCPMVIVLNMVDLLEKKGICLNENILSLKLGVPVFRISAKTKIGIDGLLNYIQNFNGKRQFKNFNFYSENVEKQIVLVQKYIFNENKRFIAIKMLEGDKLFQNNLQCNVGKNNLEKIYNLDIEQIIANERYLFIQKVRNVCEKRINTKTQISEKIDKVILNKWLALPIFAFVMSLVYVLSIGVVGELTSGPINFAMQSFSNSVKTSLTKLGAASWLVSLIVNGIIAGIGSVLSFVPQLVVIFLCISLLETSGYMSRIAFMFDSIFKHLGLSGKSIISFIVGTGCSVPAIMTTRTIENKDEKDMTAILTPFIPCSAKLPIIALFSSYFFPNHKTVIAISFYFLAIISIIISALIFKKIFYKNASKTFISELPDFRLPSAKYVLRDVFDKTKNFISRAGSVIFACSVLTWFLSSFNLKLRFDLKIENSILAKIGELFSWFFYPIIGSKNWAISVSAIQGLIAKEQVVSSLSVISGLSGEMNFNSIFESKIFYNFSKASAYSFVCFNLFSAPCIASIGAMKSELKSIKKTLFAISYQIAFSWLLSSGLHLFLSFVGL